MHSLSVSESGEQKSSVEVRLRFTICQLWRPLHRSKTRVRQDPDPPCPPAHHCLTHTPANRAVTVILPAWQLSVKAAPEHFNLQTEQIKQQLCVHVSVHVFQSLCEGGGGGLIWALLLVSYRKVVKPSAPITGVHWRWGERSSMHSNPGLTQPAYSWGATAAIFKEI